MDSVPNPSNSETFSVAPSEHITMTSKLYVAKHLFESFRIFANLPALHLLTLSDETIKPCFLSSGDDGVNLKTI